ncbi:MAG: methyltransferase domain-containing protein [Planctomycetes bacterium]|jgi:SAM-dependent methyltransferase|nr:class I SAM-dependent methyltransferase [Phycisphaerae bacterium]NBB96032.1 methyltransferase domain-containing protein [Planctomycetota bacterium]
MPIHNDDAIRRIRAHYIPRLTPGRKNYDIVNWAEPDTQCERFRVLLRDVELEGRRLLDIGCGLGCLATFLKDHDVAVDYTGVDLLPEMLERAKVAYPSGRFVCGDIFDAEYSPLAGETFDVVYASGIMNLNLGNNMEFVGRSLPVLIRHAEQAAVVNFLHDRRPWGDIRYFHYRPEDVIAIARPHCSEVRLVEDYLPNDFTLVCRPGR